jgi:hypothetical protein
MGHANTPPGSIEWLLASMLGSIQRLESRVGELAGSLRSAQDGTNRRIDDFREEMVGRMIRVEERVLKGELRQAAAVWTFVKALPWKHILTLGPLIVLGLLGHIGAAEWKQWLLRARL